MKANKELGKELIRERIIINLSFVIDIIILNVFLNSSSSSDTYSLLFHCPGLRHGGLRVDPQQRALGLAAGAACGLPPRDQGATDRLGHPGEH